MNFSRQEIPEFQTVYTIQKYLTSARISFWDFYYDYKPYTELSGWLPPFKGQSSSNWVNVSNTKPFICSASVVGRIKILCDFR